MPYSSLTREPSPITEVWYQTLRLLTSVLDTVDDAGDVAVGGPLVTCVKTFLTRFGALVLLPVRPCSFRFSLGQLRLAETSLQLLLRLHPRGAHGGRGRGAPAVAAERLPLRLQGSPRARPRRSQAPRAELLLVAGLVANGTARERRGQVERGNGE